MKVMTLDSSKVTITGMKAGDVTFTQPPSLPKEEVQLPPPPRRPKSGLCLPRVKEFGCGISVHTGTVLVAIFYLLGGIMMFAPALICGQDFIEFYKNMSSRSSKVDDLILSMEDSDYHSMTVKQNEESVHIIQTILSTIIGYGIYQTVISILLLFGVMKGTRGCMIPWLLTQGVACVISILLLFLILFLPALISEYYAMYPLIGMYSYFSQLITTFISTALYLHVFCVVLTQYRNMKNPPRHGFTPFENF